MAKKYIDAEGVMRACYDSFVKTGDKAYKEIALLVEAVPAADVAEVKHGRWGKIYGQPHIMMCSVCGSTSLEGNYNYCPNCGASMEKEDVVRHGRWIPTLIMGDRGSAGYSCSVCHKFNKTDSDYCPNCGARMVNEDE